MNEGFLVYLTYAAYAALETKDQWTLYFTDDDRVFKGDREITKTAKIVTELPAEGQIQGVVYINTTTKTAHVWVGDNWINLNVTAVDAMTDDTDATLIPNVKAVRDYVADLVEVYTAEATTTATATITDNVVKVDVKVSTAANQAIATDDTGLFVDGSKFAPADHTANTDVHVTTEQKSAWDAKIDQAKLNEAIAGVTGKLTWKTAE